MAAGQFNQLPNYPVPLEQGRNITKDWYFFWAGLFRGLAPENVAAITLGASPYVYTAPRGGRVIVNGGTVTALEFSRDGGTTYYNCGVTAGVIPLNATDFLRITYAVAPTVTFVPG